MTSEPTRGPVEVASFREHLRVQALDDDRTYICAFESPSGHPFVNREANAHLIAAAFNASTAARDLGFDAIGAIEALPELLKVVTTWESEITDGGVLDMLTGWKRELADDMARALSAARKRGDT